MFRIEKWSFPSCNSRSCATQHDFLRGKKIFRIVKRRLGRKKTDAGASVLLVWLFSSAFVGRSRARTQAA
jgi:hypothetical protein